MRLGKIAGVTAGALVASVMGVPAFMGAAHAAPTTANAAVNQDCSVVSSGNTMATALTQSLAISADGTAVSVPASAASVLHNAANGATFPTFKMESITLTVNATVNGEAVALTGTTTRAAGAGVALGDALALPALTGTRVGTADVTQAAVASVAINGTLWVPYGPPGGSRAPVVFSCAGAQDTEIKQALQCTFEAFSFTYPAVINVRTSPKVARVEAVTGFVSGMPSFVPVSKIVDNINVDVAGTALVAKGVTSFDPPAPGNTSFALPLAFAVRSGVSDVATSDVAVTGATLLMTSGGTDNTINCVTTGWPTVTTLTATSPAAEQVDLAASIDDADAAGTVQFKDGANVVATETIEDGSAAAELTGVSAGAHSYTAVFVPADEDAFGTSTSTAVSVTVQALVTQPCIDGKAALPIAQAGLATATTAATAATAGVQASSAKAASATKASTKAAKAATKAKKAEAKAKKAAKKAKGAKAKKAKKALTKAKKANTKAKKAASKASSQLKAAKAELATANANLAAANAKVATATAAVTAAQAAVAQNC